MGDNTCLRGRWWGQQAKFPRQQVPFGWFHPRERFGAGAEVGKRCMVELGNWIKEK